MIFNLFSNGIITVILLSFFILVNFNNCFGAELPHDGSGMFRSVFTIIKLDLQENDPDLLTSQTSEEIPSTKGDEHEIPEDKHNLEKLVESKLSENVNITNQLFPSLNITNLIMYTNDSKYINSLSSLSEAISNTIASAAQISTVANVSDEAICDLCANNKNVTKLTEAETVTESDIEVPNTEMIANSEDEHEMKVKSVLSKSTLTTVYNAYTTVTDVPDPTDVVNDPYTNTTKGIDQITLLVPICGVALLDFRRGKIVGGVVANPKMFPWMVNILVRQYHICAGTIVTETFVLTAAHCLVKSNARHLAVRSFAGFRRAKKVFVNPGFWLMKNDIGLIELVKPYEHLSPSCISNLPEPPVGATSLILGWGLTYEKGQPSDDLLAAEIQILPKKVCEDGYKGLYNADMICAGSPTGIPDTCHGDSGGPLLKLIEGLWYQIGIVSFGDGCGRPTTPGVYTKVELYLSWIKNVIERKLISAN